MADPTSIKHTVTTLNAFSANGSLTHFFYTSFSRRSGVSNALPMIFSYKVNEPHGFDLTSQFGLSHKPLRYILI